MGLLFQFHGQLALKFHWDKTCLYFELLSTLSTYELHWNYLISHVFLITVQEALNEYNSLTDQIWAKYQQLGSGEYGAVGTPAFNAETCELANLLAHVSQLCQKLNLLTPKESYKPTFFKHWRHFLDQNYTGQVVCLGYGGHSFVVELPGCWVPLSFKNWELTVCLACKSPL